MGSYTLQDSSHQLVRILINNIKVLVAQKMSTLFKANWFNMYKNRDRFNKYKSNETLMAECCFFVEIIIL